MTREQFDELYDGKAVWCKTEALAKEFLALADSVGYVWRIGDSLLDNIRWDGFQEETVYYVEGTITRGYRIFANTDGYEIVDFGAEPAIPALPTNQPTTVNKKEVSCFTISEIAKTLVGDLDWHGETMHDERVLERLESYEDIIIDLLQPIEKLYDVKDRYEHSAKVLSNRAKQILLVVKQYVDDVLGAE